MQESNDPDIFDAEDAEELFLGLRQLQSKTKCTEATLFEIIKLFSKYHDLEAPTKTDFQRVDRKVQKLAGATYLELHGCQKSETSCGNFVFKPDDRRKRCPLCGAARFNAKGKPHEVSFCLLLIIFIIFTHIIYHFYAESFLFSDRTEVAIVA